LPDFLKVLSFRGQLSFCLQVKESILSGGLLTWNYSQSLSHSCIKGVYQIRHNVKSRTGHKGPDRE